MAKGLSEYLVWHRNKLRVQVAVSVKAYPILKVKVLKRSLWHGDVARANREKYATIAALKAKIMAAEREADRLAGVDPITREAISMRQEFRDAAAHELKEAGRAANENHGYYAQSDVAGPDVEEGNATTWTDILVPRFNHFERNS